MTSLVLLLVVAATARADENVTPAVAPISRLSVELPNLQCPMSLIVDDPKPIYQDRLPPEQLAKRKADGKGVDWWTFFDDLANLFDEFGMKGKFTVIPWTDGIGIADKLTDPVRKRQRDAFVAFVNKRLVPNFDITPEIISHSTVIDVETDQPLGVKEPEHEWSRKQTEETLEKYIGRALLALKNIGLPANGVTSPCDFGEGNEANYVRAIGRALKRVNGVKLAWYFLQGDNGDYIEPRLMYFDRRTAEAVVSIMPTYGMGDIGLNKKFSGDIAKTADVHITADGKSGVIPRMIAGRSYMVFYKHWGIFYDSGRETGLKILREVLERTRRFYPDDVQWMTCSDIARYYAASKTCRMTQNCASSSVSLKLESPFACPGFTVSFQTGQPIKQLAVQTDGDEKRVQRAVQAGKRLEAGTWRQNGNIVFACFSLGTNTVLTVTF